MKAIEAAAAAHVKMRYDNIVRGPNEYAAEVIRAYLTALAEDEAAVERVARAMCIANDNDPDDILTSENLPRWQLWTIEARAAIRAMGGE